MYSFRGMNHAVYLFVILIFLLMFRWLQVASSLCNNGLLLYRSSEKIGANTLAISVTKLDAYLMC